MAMDSSSPFSDKAKYGLKWPIYKTMARFMARHYISLYDNDPSKNNVTLDELQLFTDAIQRWDIDSIENLPNYMKGLYEAILDFYGEIQQQNNIPFAFDQAKEAIKRDCKAYFQEAKWFYEENVPTMEEYMKVAIISAGSYVFASISFLAVGNIASKEVFQWAQTDPILLKATGVIGRLMNDITSHKFEQERGHSASAIECYMKQYEVSEEKAIAELEKEVVKAWKDVIEDYMKSTKFSNVILDCILNFARTLDLYYKEHDGYTVAEGETKDFITLMLTKPVSI